MSDREMTDAERVDYSVGKGADFTAGLGASYGEQISKSDPRECVMRAEEERESDAEEQQEKMGFLSELMHYALRAERFREPEVANRLLWMLVITYYPALISHVPRAVQSAQVSARWSVRGSGAVAELVGKKDGLRREVFRTFLADFLFLDVTAHDPMMPAKRLYALAKAYFPQMIADSSLHELGEMFESERDAERHRARWSYRVKTWVIKRVSDAGYVGHAYYQKGAEASAKSAAAARRTCNRRKKN